MIYSNHTVINKVIFDLNLIYVFGSTCVNEARICEGVPLCPNKHDLRWCKETPIQNWMPFSYLSNQEYLNFTYCTLSDHPNRTDLQYQQIKEFAKGNKFYNCLNRLDENPFFKKLGNDTGDITEEELWWINVNTTCEYDKWPRRRCLGHNSDQCIYPHSKHT